MYLRPGVPQQFNLARVVVQTVIHISLVLSIMHSKILQWGMIRSCCTMRQCCTDCWQVDHQRGSETDNEGYVSN